MPGLTPSGLEARVHAVLDARLQSGVDQPVAVALSGGGDSMALLELASTWSERHGRRLVAITVDHGLNPDSPAWSDRSCEAAQALGVDWTGCRWLGDKPTTGLPAAARRARHALIADAAREIGALVVLFAHTADDIDESEWMKAAGSTLGALRAWSASPAWPEGRGMMILRPLLEERRADLRDWLRSRGRTWIEDPANGDVRFARSRARQALARQPLEASPGAPKAEAIAPRDGRLAEPVEATLGLVRMARDIDAKALSAALVCAAGTARPPRGDRIGALRDRLASGEVFTATLAGGRLVAGREGVLLGREPGELKRRGLAALPLTPDVAAVWDGRFEITTALAGWTVVAAAGRLNRLSEADRAVLSRLPSWARGAAPVLIRDDDPVPVLAWRGARVVTLAHRRLALALGETTHEGDLGRTIHGETPPTDLFSG